MRDKEAKAAPREAADWEAIERDYRAGILSLREIAKAHGITEGAIRKRAKRDLWSRDLKAKIQQRADELVRNEVVRTAGTQLTPADRRDTVEVNAQLQSRVRLEARGDVDELEKLVRNLRAELMAETTDIEAFQRLGELLDTSEEDEETGKVRQDKRNEIYNRVISASWRVDAAKKLVEMTEKLILLKFKVYGVELDEDRGQGVEAMLRRLGEMGV